jgi:N-methylhydantoinase B
MGTTLERAGGTVNTTQMHDYVTALYLANGDILAAGEGLVQHVACAGVAVRRIIERFEHEGGIYPDDIFLLNDPYLAAIHQSDVYLISPIHYQDRLMAWSATFVHVMDIGAMSPGGNSPGASEIYHEGLRIPGIKLVERGKLRKDVFDTLVNMTRQPVMVGLDLKCEIAANNVAKSRMQELYSHYGPELVEAVCADMIRYSEYVLQKRVAEIPDGSWSDTLTMEADEPRKVVLTLRKKGNRLVFDFTGSDRQATQGINLPYHGTVGGCFALVLFTLGYDLPKNHGLFGSIEVIAPEGTVVNVQPPGPCSMSTTSSMFVVLYLAGSVLMQMLATSEKWKKEVTAVNVGHRSVRLAGMSQHGRYFVTSLAEGGFDAIGARSFGDGVNSGGSMMSMSSHNVEWFELNFPVLYLFRRHVKDGCGAGMFRGGVGAEVAITPYNAPEQKIKGVAYGVAGLRNSGQGIFGGFPGAPCLLRLIEDTKIGNFIGKSKSPDDLAKIGGQPKLLSYCDFDFGPNDVLYMTTQNGGGYGDPLDRDPQLVLDDVINGLVSVEAAHDLYGVVLIEGGHKLDLAATQDLRSVLREERLETT